MRLVRWIAACGVILAACGGGSGGNPLQPPGPSVTADTVTIVDNSFGPTAVAVTPGGTVTWIWNGTNTMQHNVSWASGPGSLPGNSTTQATGTPYSVTFNDVGTYQFVCTLHSNMGGTVFVQP